MARTSRKGGAAPSASVLAQRLWRAAVYARLSMEDSGRKGADTIETQIELVTSYVRERPYLSVAGIYIDNGASGADFDRPAWNRLMDDIRAGRVDCVAVKDLSRFGRNYIEACELLEKIFPFMGLRFISVNDGYDSESAGGHSEGLILALKNLINDKYLRDISRKICSSVQAKRERGEYTRGFAPFGYQKISGQKGKLEPDPETAPVVRDIYIWRAEGLSHVAICKRLEAQGTPTPNEYLRRKLENKNFYSGEYFKSTIWRTATLKIILRSPAYIGTLEQGKESQRLYERKPCTDVPRDQWVVTENVHEPIVSRELWSAVQAIEAATREAYLKSAQRPERTENIFKGFVICAACSSKMSRSYNKKVMVSGRVWETYYFLCPIHRQHKTEHAYRSIREDVIYNAVFPAVSAKLKMAGNLAAIIEKRSKRQNGPRAALNAELAKATRELEKTSERLAGLYENYAVKLLSEREYVRVKGEYERRAEALRNRAEELVARAALISDTSVSDNKWLKAARSFQNPTELTREMLEAIVDKIVITDPEHIDITWKFTDEFALLEVCAREEAV